MAQHYGPNIVTDGLVGYWDAADKNSYPGSGTTWKDLSGNGYNGTLTNGPTFDSGNGGSIVFDGSNDYVDIPDMGFTGNAAISVDAWVKCDSLSDRNGIFTIGIAAAMERIDFEAGTPYSSDAGNIGIHFSSYTWSTDTDILVAGQWHHIVFTITGTSTIPGNLAYYIDSKSQTITQEQGSGAQTLDLENTNYFIGARREGDADGAATSLFHDGGVANLKVFNKALSAAEVVQNFNAQRSRFGV